MGHVFVSVSNDSSCLARQGGRMAVSAEVPEAILEQFQGEYRRRYPIETLFCPGSLTCMTVAGCILHAPVRHLPGRPSVMVLIRVAGLRVSRPPSGEKPTEPQGIGSPPPQTIPRGRDFTLPGGPGSSRPAATWLNTRPGIPAPTPDPDGEEVHGDVSPLESVLEEVCQTGCVLDRWPQIDHATPRQNRK